MGTFSNPYQARYFLGTRWYRNLHWITHHTETKDTSIDTILRFVVGLIRTAIGIRVKDGVVLAVEKLIQSKLLVPGANRRIQNVDRHIGIVRPISLLSMICRKQGIYILQQEGERSMKLTLQTFVI